MQTYRMPHCRILFLAIVGMMVLLKMQPSYTAYIKQWGHYLEGLEVKALIKSVTNHAHSYMEITFSVYYRLRQGIAVVCPNIQYSFLTDSPRKTRGLCGRIDIVTNSAKNTENIQTTYTILVPLKFNINFSLVGFSEDFDHLSYTGCGFNDILISSGNVRWATFCGKPVQQTVIVRDSIAHIQSYHRCHEDEDSTLHLKVYFEVIPMQTEIHSQEHHMLFSQLKDFYPSGVVSYMIGSMSELRYHLNIYKVCENCHYDTALTQQRKELLRKRYPTMMTKALNRFSTLGYMAVNDDLAPSHFRVHSETIRIFDSTDSLSMHEQIQHTHQQKTLHFVPYFSPNLKHDLNMYNLLLTTPRNLLQPLYSKLVHTSETGPSLVEVWVWTIHGPQFENGLLQFGQLSVEIQRENCPTEDTVVVYDGPYGGMLTSHGLTSPFAVLYDGSCKEITDAVNSSLGDLTLYWIHRNAEESDVGFAYSQQPVRCSQISCTYTNVSVTNLEKTLIFEQTDMPSFQVLHFDASDNGNVQLRFQIHTVDIPHSVEGCLYSALWLFEDSLRAVFCTQTNLMLLNSSTIQKEGLQLNRLAKLVVKSYPQSVRIKFSISYSTGICFGLLNPCINSLSAKYASHGRCFPHINHRGLISISGSQVRDCCYVLSYLENSISLPLHCHFGFRHSSVDSLLRVNHREFTAPFKISCCNDFIITATLHINSKVFFYMKGCLYSVPRLKNQTFLTSGFDINVHRNRNTDGCSSIIAVAGEQANLCLDLEIPESVARKLVGFNTNLALLYSCIRTGLRVSPYLSIQITAYANTFDMEMEYNFKMNGTIEIHKVTMVNIKTLPVMQYGGEWEWELFLTRLHNESFHFIDSQKVRRRVTLNSASIKIRSSFVLEFKIKKLRQINSDTFYTTTKMHSSLWSRSAYTLLSRRYREVAAGSLSWLEASGACTGRGMTLLSLNSEQEWLALAAFLFEKGHDVATVYLGLRRQQVGDSKLFVITG